MRPTDKALREAVLHRLAALDRMAESADEESLLPLARAELYRLANGWRLLLAVHQPGEDGRCRACPGAFRRRRRWPCRVWLMANRHLVGESLPRGRARLLPWRTRSAETGTAVVAPAWPSEELPPELPG